MPKKRFDPRTALLETSGTTVLREVLSASVPRPDPSESQAVKSAYAVRFADTMARVIARDLAPWMPGIEATTKRGSMSARGKKQLDINFSTPRLGLALGISLKSVHLRETNGGRRYTHNMKRNEEELRIEASGYHKRQPYAVMVGVLFLPFDSCADARSARTSSSFGSWVRHLRPCVGRTGPTEDGDRFERLYLALYEPDGTNLAFFDVRSSPPKNARPLEDGEPFGPEGRDHPPRRLLKYGEFLEEIHGAYLRRNSVDFVWADGEKEPLAFDELDATEE